ncbi:MAG: hypothetical protein QOD86_2909 [Miltoncostaeaceae bacterium]|nr:hypothetical protein [Miltoncostaeaceae bacterium]
MRAMRIRPWRPWRTLPVRVRLTLIFALVVGIVLALAGLLVYVQFRQSIDSRMDAELADRQTTLIALARVDDNPRRLVARAGEALLQVYGPDGRLLGTTRNLGQTRLIDTRDAARARVTPSTLTNMHIPSLDDGARVRAFALPGGSVAAIGEPRDDRERALHRLAAILIVTLPGALALASLAGYRVASSALRPVDAMRAEAEEIGRGERGRRLPEPGTRDELDRLATTLNDLLGRLEAALEHERRVVGDASHELRTPVSVLLTRLDVALRRHDLDEAGLRQVIADARGDARRLSRLADDLLLLARADQGRLPLRRAPLEIHELVAAASARHADDAAGRVVVVEEIAGGAVVLADPDRTAQVLDNLIANALVHGEAPVEVRAFWQDGDVAVSVRDHGAGYPEEFLPRAFERFSQADDGSGSGLGLSISEAIVRAQGGRITAANAAGGGAVVTFSLPAA